MRLGLVRLVTSETWGGQMTGIIATQERAGLAEPVWGAQCWDKGRGQVAADQGVK